MSKKPFDKMNRPDWDIFAMLMAFVASQRSIDQTTKHGTVCLHKDNSVLSAGYNGPARGRKDSEIPQTRPEKYSHILHSESAAIINAARHGIPLKDSKFYVTGHPCEKCISEIINVGASEVVYGPVYSHQITKDKQDIIREILEGQDIKITKFENVLELLELVDRVRGSILKYYEGHLNEYEK